jgi:uncharacterized DUF497 family protein
MDITYDAVKNKSNAEKHGVSLAEAVEFEWDEALAWSDERQNYGEARACAESGTSATASTTWCMSIAAMSAESSACARRIQER